MTHQQVYFYKSRSSACLFGQILASVGGIYFSATACLVAIEPADGSGGGPPTSITIESTFDTALFQPSPTNNSGGLGFIPIGVTGQGLRTRGLFKFDLTSVSVPSNATISSVVFSLNYLFGSRPATASTYDVHRILQDWGEGTGVGGASGLSAVGRPAQSNEASWRHRFAPSTLWAAAGGDYNATPSASAIISALGTNSFTSAGLLADVQAWRQNPSQNFGWMVKLGSEAGFHLARRFGSSETNANLRPTLTLNFEFPPEVSNPRVNGNQFEFEFSARAGKAYRVERRDSLAPETSWLLMTNLPTQNVNGTIVVADLLTAGNRFYRVGAQ